jgi:hypothetical protein
MKGMLPGTDEQETAAAAARQRARIMEDIAHEQ